MILSHKIRLVVNNEQEEFLKRSCGCARFAYNWGLAKWTEMYNAWKEDNSLPKPNAYVVKKEYNSVKEAEYPWIYDSPKDANAQAFMNLGAAFTNFFSGRSGYPVFKKRGRKDSFYLGNTVFKLDGKYITLPKIGKIKMREELRFEGKINSCIISRHADGWYASISVDVRLYRKDRTEDRTVGIDFGIKTFATLDDGTKTFSPKPLVKLLGKLKRVARRFSKKVKGSKNSEKCKVKLSRLHKGIGDIRKDFSHKFTTDICRQNQTVCIEDLCVKGWAKMFGKNAVDVGIGEVVRQLVYKAEIYQTKLIKIDRYYPSSKTCSSCGHVKKELGLHERIFHCEKCGLKMCRDVNAAKCVRTAGLAGIDACGHLASDLDLSIQVKSDGRNKNLDIVNV